MTFTFGSWVWPAAVTIIAAGLALVPDRGPPRGDYDFGGAIMGALRLIVALIVSLIAWLTWALLR